MYLLFVLICKMNDSHDGPLGQSWMRVKYVLSLQVLIRGKIVEFLSRKMALYSYCYCSIALAKCVEEGVNHMWTVSAIQMHPKGLIVCDEDATLELHVKVRDWLE